MATALQTAERKRMSKKCCKIINKVNGGVYKRPSDKHGWDVLFAHCWLNAEMFEFVYDSQESFKDEAEPVSDSEIAYTHSELKKLSVPKIRKIAREKGIADVAAKPSELIDAIIEVQKGE